MFASVNLPLHHKVQKFSSATDSPGWSRKKGHKTLMCVCVCNKKPKTFNKTEISGGDALRKNNGERVVKEVQHLLLSEFLCCYVDHTAVM